MRKGLKSGAASRRGFGYLSKNQFKNYSYFYKASYQKYYKV